MDAHLTQACHAYAACETTTADLCHSFDDATIPHECSANMIAQAIGHRMERLQNRLATSDTTGFVHNVLHNAEEALHTNGAGRVIDGLLIAVSRHAQTVNDPHAQARMLQHVANDGNIPAPLTLAYETDRDVMDVGLLATLTERVVDVSQEIEELRSPLVVAETPKVGALRTPLVTERSSTDVDAVNRILRSDQKF